MKPRHHGLALGILMLVVGAGALAADDPCTGFTWNVAHERSLFAEKAASAKAGAEVASAPAIKSDHLYELALTAQDQVHFPAPPGKAPRADGSYAGLLKLKLTTGGLYRISVDQPFWIDVILHGEPIHSTDYQGAFGCNAPHKIVQFLLPAGQDLVVQVSGMPSAQARLAVTFAPAAK